MEETADGKGNRVKEKEDDANPVSSDNRENQEEKDCSNAKEDKPPAEPGSPDTACSICLSKIENKSFSDSCFHTFCFRCLLEWSKMKPVCPLCKQPFKSIIHNVRSLEDYDQYELSAHQQQKSRWDATEARDDRRFHYRTTLTSQRLQAQRMREEERQFVELLQRPTRATARFHWRRQRQVATSEFRRQVYRTGMRVSEVRTACGRPMRYREISPEFFTRNPACTHRLVPWLNREINVLLHNHTDHLEFLLQLIIDLVKRFHIQSAEFAEHIRSFFGRNTDHFIHEFYMFARSPYDLSAYDQHAVYDLTSNSTELHEISSSDNDSPQDVIAIEDISDGILLQQNHSGGLNLNSRDDTESIIVLDSDEDSGEDVVVTRSYASHNLLDPDAFDVDISPGAPTRRSHYQRTMDIDQPSTSLYNGFRELFTSSDTGHTSWDDPVVECSLIPKIDLTKCVPSTSAVVYIAHEDQPSTSRGTTRKPVQRRTVADSDSDDSSDIQCLTDTPASTHMDTSFSQPVQSDGPYDQPEQPQPTTSNNGLSTAAENTAAESIDNAIQNTAAESNNNENDADSDDTDEKHVKVKHESYSSWEGSDIEIVGYEKPWDERTPEPLSSLDEAEKKELERQAAEEAARQKKEAEKLAAELKEKEKQKQTRRSRSSSSSSSSRSSSSSTCYSRRRKRRKRSRSRSQHHRRRRRRSSSDSAFSEHKRRRDRRRTPSRSRSRERRRQHRDKHRDRTRSRHSRSPSHRSKRSRHSKKKSRSRSPLVYSRSKPRSGSRTRRTKSPSRRHHRPSPSRARSSADSTQEYSTLGKYDLKDKRSKPSTASKNTSSKPRQMTYAEELAYEIKKAREKQKEMLKNKEKGSDSNANKGLSSFSGKQKDCGDNGILKTKSSSVAGEWINSQAKKTHSSKAVNSDVNTDYDGNDKPKKRKHKKRDRERLSDSDNEVKRVNGSYNSSAKESDRSIGNYKKHPTGHKKSSNK